MSVSPRGTNKVYQLGGCMGTMMKGDVYTWLNGAGYTLLLRYEQTKKALSGHDSRKTILAQ